MGVRDDRSGPAGDYSPRFGQFRIVAPLGSNRLGSLFLARLDGDFPDAPAILLTVFRRRTDDEHPLTMEAVTERAQPVPTIRNRNLVCYHECGRVADRLYLVCDYPDAVPLDLVLAAVKEFGMTPGERVVMAILRQVAQGLRALHYTRVDGWNLQLVHGRLKPANILLLRDGRIQLRDYSLTPFVNEFTRYEKDTAAKTPPLYYSPEQVRREPLTQASDVFSFGTIAAELSTGNAVFNTPKYRGSLQKIKLARVGSTLTAVRTAVPSLALTLENCFKLDPDRRYPDGSALLEALEAVDPSDDELEQVCSFMNDIRAKKKFTIQARGMAPSDLEMLDALADSNDRVSFTLAYARPTGPAARESLGSLDEPIGQGDKELGETDDLGDTEDLDVTDASATIQGVLTVAEVLASAGDAGTSFAEGLPSPADVGVSGRDSIFDEEESVYEDSVSVDMTKAAAAELAVEDEDEDIGEGRRGPGDDSTTAGLDEDPSTTSLDVSEEALTASLEIEDPSPEPEAEPPLPPQAPLPTARASTFEQSKVGSIPTPAPDSAPPRPTVRSRELKSYEFKHGEEPKTRKLWPWFAGGAAALLAVGAVAIPLLSGEPPAEKTDEPVAEVEPQVTPGVRPVAGAIGAQPQTEPEPLVEEAVEPSPDLEDGVATAAEEPQAVPLLDPAILGTPMPDRSDPVETAGESATAPVEEPATATEPPQLTHKPASRGIRGRAIQLAVTVSPPGSYSGTLHYRGSGGSWKSASISGGESGTLSATIPAEARADGDGESIEYYLEVAGPGGNASAGSSANPFRVKLY